MGFQDYQDRQDRRDRQDRQDPGIQFCNVDLENGSTGNDLTLPPLNFDRFSIETSRCVPFPPVDRIPV